jgi:hypothetical protein
MVSTNAAPVNATAQKSLGPVSEATSAQVQEVGRRHGGRHHFRHRGGGRNYYRHGGRHRFSGGHYRRHGRHHRHRGFYFGAPFFYGGYGYYDDYPYYSYSYNDGNYCYRECREFHSRNYCRYNWRRYC